MPSCPRSEIVCPEEIGVYHCWSRCVRRAFLCGHDPVSGENYEYRRNWIYQMQEVLAGLFGIEIAFRAELSNHIHLVLRNRPDVVQTWTDDDVVRRWLTITKLAKSRDGSVREPHAARVAIELALPGRVKRIRKRLSDPSWLMGVLCEYIARRSNREDGCSGCFWEDRYRCRDLVDEAAILICGIYVDLNQIRAGEALTPESSTHTSAFDRIQARLQRQQGTACGGQSPSTYLPDGWLCQLTLDERASVNDPSVFASASSRRASDMGLLPISLDDYLQLLDASGRIVRDQKSGSIPDHLANILDRLGVRAEMWATLVTGYDRMFGRVVGAPAKLAQRAAVAGRRWYRGQSQCAAAFT